MPYVQHRGAATRTRLTPRPRIAPRRARNAQLGNFFSTAIQDVENVASRVGAIGADVSNISRQVQGQAPNIYAIAQNPGAAYAGAVTGAQTASFYQQHPILIAATVGVGVFALYKLFR